MNVLMFAQFTLNLIIQVGLSYILGTFHILQIVCFQTMMNIEYPANAQFASHTIIDILNADVLNPELVYNLLFNFNFDLQLDSLLENDERYWSLNIIPQIKDMGFKTFNPILNLGGLFIVFLFVTVQFAVYGCVKTFLKYQKFKGKDI